MENRLLKIIILAAVFATFVVTPSASAAQFNVDKAKQQLLIMVDRLQKHLQTNRAKIASVRSEAPISSTGETVPVPNDQQNSLLAIVDQYLGQLAQLKITITNAADRDTLKTAAQQIHGIITAMRLNVHKQVAQRLQNNIDQFMAHKDNFLNHATKTLQIAQTRGLNVAELQQALAACDQSMKDGSMMLEQAKAKLAEIQKSSNDDQSAAPLQAGFVLIRQSHEKLQTSQACGRQLILRFKTFQVKK